MVLKTFTLLIDPRTRISYASYYLEGIKSYFGIKKLKFSYDPFKDLIQNSGIDDFDQYFAFIIYDENNGDKRIVIDYRDKSNFSVNALEWCDVYGKVNLNRNTDYYLNIKEEFRPKIIPLGPNFGIRIWSHFQTFSNLISNYYKSLNKLPVSFRNFLAGYNWQLKRNSLSFYKPYESSRDYVFHISSLYSTQAYGEITNQMRASFVRACKQSIHNFEGGLFTKKYLPIMDNYSDVLTSHYITPEDYLLKTKMSSFVFNTPAAWGCHGWKLGEYLALGKAIISTPFINEMPYPMEDGENILFAENEVEIYKAVSLLSKDDKLRSKLEMGAQKYYNNYLAPEVVLKKLINVNTQ